jgi:hypothetical protein
VPAVGGDRFDIQKEKPEHFSFIVFYRGLHCPICRTQLGELESLAVARTRGLCISTGRGMTSAGIEELALFSEPGLFLVRPDRTLYIDSVQAMPFARAHFTDILTALDYVVAKNYPPAAK